uniref:MFS domain-containing protein n=1 Tax=Parastrongyloides trichosuri TaxID=131310 RepID=A0A0N5A6S1_PARTI
MVLKTLSVGELKKEDVIVVEDNTKKKDEGDDDTFKESHNKDSLENIMQGRTTDWYSIYMMYSMSLLAGIQLTIYFTSIWPYVLLLNPSSQVSALGYVISAFSLGQAFGSPFFGALSTKMKANKIPITIGLVVVIIGNIIYAILPNFPKDNIVLWICFSRLLVCFGSEKNGILRSYWVCIQNDRRKVVALSIASFVMDVTVGSVFQALCTSLGSGKYKFLFLTINMFTLSPIIMSFV